jgi:hypothetical protein
MDVGRGADAEENDKDERLDVEDGGLEGHREVSDVGGWDSCYGRPHTMMKEACDAARRGSVS